MLTRNKARVSRADQTLAWFTSNKKPPASGTYQLDSPKTPFSSEDQIPGGIFLHLPTLWGVGGAFCSALVMQKAAKPPRRFMGKWLWLRDD